MSCYKVQFYPAYRHGSIIMSAVLTSIKHTPQTANLSVTKLKLPKSTHIRLRKFLANSDISQVDIYYKKQKVAKIVFSDCQLAHITIHAPSHTMTALKKRHLSKSCFQFKIGESQTWAIVYMNVPDTLYPPIEAQIETKDPVYICDSRPRCRPIRTTTPLRDTQSLCGIRDVPDFKGAFDRALKVTSSVGMSNLIPQIREHFANGSGAQRLFLEKKGKPIALIEPVPDTPEDYPVFSLTDLENIFGKVKRGETWYIGRPLILASPEQATGTKGKHRLTRSSLKSAMLQNPDDMKTVNMVALIVPLSGSPHAPSGPVPT